MGAQADRVLVPGPINGAKDAGQSACVIGGGKARDIGSHDYVIRMLGHGSVDADYIVALDHRPTYRCLEKEKPDCVIWVYGGNGNPDLDKLAPGFNTQFIEYDIIRPYVADYRNMFSSRCSEYPGRGCIAGILAILLLPIDRLYFYGCDKLMTAKDMDSECGVPLVKWRTERKVLSRLAASRGIMIIH